MHMLLRWRQECIPIKKPLRHMDRVLRGQVKGGGGKRVSGGMDVVGCQTCHISLQAFYFVQDLWRSVGFGLRWTCPWDAISVMPLDFVL